MRRKLQEWSRWLSYPAGHEVAWHGYVFRAKRVTTRGEQPNTMRDMDSPFWRRVLRRRVKS